MDDELNARYKDSIMAILIYFILYVIVHGCMAMRLGLAVEEAKFAREIDWCLLCNGRWGIQLFRLLTFSNDYLPFSAGIVAGVFISLAIHIQTLLFNIKSVITKFLYAAFYVGCVQWVYQLRYSNQSHAVAFAILLITGAVYILYNCHQYRYVLVSLFMTCWAIGTYQTLILYMAELIIVAELFRFGTDSEQGAFYRIFRAIAVLVGGFVLCFIISKAIIHFVKIPIHTVKFVDEYQGNMVGWFSRDSINIKDLFVYIIWLPLRNLLGKNYHGQYHIISAIIPAIILVVQYVRKMRLASTCKGICYIGLMLYIPFSMGAILLWGGGTRLNIAEPMVAASLWALASQRVGFFKVVKIKYALIIISAYSVILGSARSAEFARDEGWSFQRSSDELMMMYLRGQQAAMVEGTPDCRIVLLGNIRSHSGYFYDVEREGYRLHEPNPDILRNAGWLDDYKRFLRLPRLIMGSANDMQKHKECFNTLTIWPADNSVKANKGEVIIRIGE